MEKMAYFKEITDGQHLDDVDISVHCDIKIFDWLMCWVKYDNIMDKPSLDSASVVSILVSASFLKASPERNQTRSQQGQAQESAIWILVFGLGTSCMNSGVLRVTNWTNFFQS